jgi:hypothetical protein
MVLSDVLRRVLYNIVSRQYHGQNQQGQTMVYKAHRRTSDNTMTKTNNEKQCYSKHIEECQTIPWPFWPWYCLTFFDVFCITLFVLVGFGLGIA